jgi:hypothetical protein
MSDFHWLLLKNGQLVIGTKGNGNRVSWAILRPDGTQSAVNDWDVLDARPLRKPKVRTSVECTVIGEIGE